MFEEVSVADVTEAELLETAQLVDVPDDRRHIQRRWVSAGVCAVMAVGVVACLALVPPHLQRALPDGLVQLQGSPLPGEVPFADEWLDGHVQGKWKVSDKDAALFEAVRGKEGLTIWRIRDFDLEPVPAEDYGKFHTGDSYIVSNGVKDGGAMKYDIHVWTGKRSGIDEQSMAMMKLQHLDDFFDDLPKQHRELQGFEGELFRSYFPNFELLKGGYDTGFKPDVPKPTPVRFLIHKVPGAHFDRIRVTKYSDCSVPPGTVVIHSVVNLGYTGKGFEVELFINRAPKDMVFFAEQWTRGRYKITSRFAKIPRTNTDTLPEPECSQKPSK